MIKAIITDIEGTTSAISFVKDVLFPYARANISTFVKTHAQQPEIKALLEEVCSLVGEPLTQEAIIQQLIAWIDTDQKITPLKALQGLIWADGYVAGNLQGHIYADVIPVLDQWHQQDLKLYVYSSGSVLAQKLLFGHTSAGDITPLFSGYFDTHIGAKQESASYPNILQEIGFAANELLFLSDIVAELDAAHTAGMHTYCLCREGVFPAAQHHPTATDFTQIDLTQFHSA